MTGRRRAAVLALAAGLAACDGAAADDPVRLVIVNDVTEALIVAVETERCLDGADALDGAVILIEKPRRAAELRVDRTGDCADAAPALDLALGHLAGGVLGRITLEWDGDGRLVPAAEGSRENNACASVDRAEDEDGRPVITIRFARCE